MDTETRILFLPVALAGLAILGLAAPAHAQSTCDLRLQESLYQAGKLSEARRAAEDCLAAKASREEKIAGAELLAQIDLAEDDLAAARRRIEDLLRDEPAFKPSSLADSPRFLRLVEQVRQDTSSVQVSSVSKTPESLREAPATVVVVTAEEIERRGYRDLEEILHDLPGFDISRVNGLSYSNFYQRGYRSDLPTRTLLLVDGVEENELWTQAAYLSRQYPVSNVERVEVIYGPASTMYGANAFAGVINVITREPESYLENGRRRATRVSALQGSFGTSSYDLDTAGKTKNGLLSWSLTGHLFHSDEMSLASQPDLDYSLDTIDYRRAQRVSGVNSLGQPNAQIYLDAKKPGDSPYYTVQRDAAGVATAIELTDAGVERARELDRAVYQNDVGRTPAFSDGTDDWAIHAKLKLPNLVLGFQTWRRAEGINPSQADQRHGPTADGMLWIPQQWWLYAKFNRPITRELSVSLFSQYKLHELADPTSFSLFNGYASGTLGVADLNAGKQGGWSPVYFYLTNSQFSNELSLVYTPSGRFTVVGGVQVKSSSLQGNYVTSATRNPSSTASGDPAVAGGNRFNALDLGAYVQASLHLPWHLKAVAGGRFDNNRVRSAGGYGTVFNPRLALLWAPPGSLVLKAIYSEAFQDASNFQKYVGARGTAIPNPDLAPERVKNLELGASWQSGKRLTVDASVYDARYSDVVQFVAVPCTLGPAACGDAQVVNQSRGVGALHIYGLQANAALKLDRLSVSANYTFTHPWNVLRDVRVGDIARHHANLDVSSPLGRRLDLDLRVSYVGARQTGAGTDVPTNPFREIGAATLLNASLRLKELLPGLPGTELQLAVDNLTDQRVYDPGIRQADGINTTSRVLQPGRAFYLRLSTRF
jgi:outer membrane receptor for ferrienterochelin and colicin